MKLAIFDLDNTLIAGDSDHLWGQYLAEQGRVDKAQRLSKQADFYRAYREGTLDINAFLRFQLQPLAEHKPARLREWHRHFMQQCIRPILLPDAHALVQKHRDSGHALLVATATNRFITEPIVAEFAIPHLIATEPEYRNGRFTGRVSGTPAYAEGKLSRLQDWLQQQDQPLEESWFYSDSHTDLPLLQWVDHPVAVDPDARLHNIARKAGWKMQSLRTS